MDATNNARNTLEGYLEKVAASLREVTPLRLSQPLFDDEGERIQPMRLPTNLAVDGADLFSMVGLEYYKRAGVLDSYPTDGYLSDRLLPRRLDDKYDRVLYPLNILTRAPASQMDAARWWLNRLDLDRKRRGIVILWAGNNDSSTASLGTGALSPTYQPIPFGAIERELSPALRLLLSVAEARGLVSFAPFTVSAIERNLTERSDFAIQYEHLLDLLAVSNGALPESVDVFALTLPYYTGVGYLMDADDLELYFRKLNADYVVPTSFQRPDPGQSTAVNGDRIALPTFVLMYAMLSTGFSVADINAVLEAPDGSQNDGLVLSEAEQGIIVERIDSFNDSIRELVEGRGAGWHLVDVGATLNEALAGETTIEVAGRTFTRGWGRGHAFSLDGVHPGYTIQGYVANQVIAGINDATGLEAPLRDLESIVARDVYIDRDGDGWVSGPDGPLAGAGALLSFFRDPNDNDPGLQPELPPDIWDQISAILLRSLLGIDAVRTEAERLRLPSGDVQER
jgi:hypothetical protein